MARPTSPTPPLPADPKAPPTISSDGDVDVGEKYALVSLKDTRRALQY